MALPRFYQPDLPESGNVELADAEIQHASNSLRMTPGEQAILFDGKGGEALAAAVEVTRKRALFEIQVRTDTSRELPFELSLAVALPKGDRQKTMVEGLVQLGVQQLTPLGCHRSVAKAGTKAVERLQRWVIECSKQCGRNQLMTVHDELSLNHVSSAAESEQTFMAFAHPYSIEGYPQPTPLAELVSSVSEENRQVQVLVGPEGGFTDAECVALLDLGWTQFSLGPRILRVEMAAICVAAVLGNG